MPSIVGHSLAGAVGGNSWFQVLKKLSTRRLIILSILCANLPDFDVLFVHLGFDQAGFFGHRNFFHSIFFAIIAAPIIGFLSAPNEDINTQKKLSLYFLAMIMSHNLLDMLTLNSGVGIFYPLMKEHLLFPVTPLLPAGFTLESFKAAFIREMQVLWLPCLILIVFFKLRGKTANSNPKN